MMCSNFSHCLEWWPHYVLAQNVGAAHILVLCAHDRNLVKHNFVSCVVAIMRLFEICVNWKMYFTLNYFNLMRLPRFCDTRIMRQNRLRALMQNAFRKLLNPSTCIFTLTKHTYFSQAFECMWERSFFCRFV